LPSLEDEEEEEEEDAANKEWNAFFRLFAVLSSC
jgi:hypothetical protein